MERVPNLTRTDAVAAIRNPLAFIATRWTPTPRTVQRAALTALVMAVVIVVTGGAVRLTGSGLGCPTWPKCTDDSLTATSAMGVHGAIEFGNRMLTYVLCAAVGWAIIAARSEKPRRRSDGIGQFAAHPAARQPPARGAPHLAGARRLGGERETVPYARHRREGDRVRGRAVHGLGEVGEEGLDGAGGVGDLFGEEFQADDLAGLGGGGGGQFGGPGEVAGQSGVDQIGRDAAAPQQPAARLQDAQFAAPGQVAGGRTVRFQAQ